MAGQNNIPHFQPLSGLPAHDNEPDISTSLSKGFFKGFYTTSFSPVHLTAQTLLPSQLSFGPLSHYAIAIYQPFCQIFNAPVVIPTLPPLIQYTTPSLNAYMMAGIPCAFASFTQPCWNTPIPLSTYTSQFVPNCSFTTHSSGNSESGNSPVSYSASQSYQHYPYAKSEPQRHAEQQLASWQGYYPPKELDPSYTHTPETQPQKAVTKPVTNKTTPPLLPEKATSDVDTKKGSSPVVTPSKPQKKSRPVPEPAPKKNQEQPPIPESSLKEEDATGSEALTKPVTNKKTPLSLPEKPASDVGVKKDSSPPVAPSNPQKKSKPLPEPVSKKNLRKPPISEPPRKKEDATEFEKTFKTWPAYLQTLYLKRQNGPDAKQDLLDHGEKRDCWSWQWFPTIFREKTSQERQDCAFHNFNELIQYYNTPALRDEFIELAEIAVGCSMKKNIDEKYLLESLLLCRYAAEQCFDSKIEEKLLNLINIQKGKGIPDFPAAELEIQQWLMAQEKSWHKDPVTLKKPVPFPAIPKAMEESSAPAGLSVTPKVTKKNISTEKKFERHGFSLIATTYNGDCFYDAAAQQLEGETIASLRQRMHKQADQILNDPEIGQRYFDGSGSSREELAQRVRGGMISDLAQDRVSHWATQEELPLLALTCHRPVALYDENAEISHLYDENGHRIENSPQLPDNAICLAYLNKVHFMGVQSIIKEASRKRGLTDKTKSDKTTPSKDNKRAETHTPSDKTAIASGYHLGAIKHFMNSERGNQLSEKVLGPNNKAIIKNMENGICPLGFKDQEQYQSFMNELADILRKNGTDGRVTLQGSSTTFISDHPHKGKTPDINEKSSLEKDIKELHFFDKGVIEKGGLDNIGEYERFGVLSDLDLVIESPSLVSKLRAKKVPRAPANIGGNYNQDHVAEETQSLWEFKFKWQGILQRDVNFVCHHDKDAHTKLPASLFFKPLTP